MERLDVDLTSEFENSLPHAGDAHAGISRRAINSVQVGLGNSFPIVADLNFN